MPNSFEGLFAIPLRLKLAVDGEQVGECLRSHACTDGRTTRKHNTSNPSITRSSAIAEGPRDASCQLKSCQLPRNSAETTYTTSPDQIDGMKLEI